MGFSEISEIFSNIGGWQFLTATRLQCFLANDFMKCDVCSKTLAETFLKKLIGSYVKAENGKLHPVCRECQKKLLTKKELLKNIK